MTGISKTRLLQPLPPESELPPRSIETEEILRDRVNEMTRAYAVERETRQRAERVVERQGAQLEQIRQILGL